MAAKRWLWVVSGGAEAVPGIEVARQMGLKLIVSDQNPAAPGFALADIKVLASTYDWQATVAAGERHVASGGRIDGVISMSADVPLTVAKMAGRFGLPGISVDTARLASDKLAMKQHLAAAGIPVPWFAAVQSAGEVQRLLAERGGPLVLKPVDSRGARGVLLIDRQTDLDWAFAESLANSPTRRVMVEQFCPGRQNSTEALLLDGNTAVNVGFSDRNYEYLWRFAPFIIENGGEQPSEMPDGQQKEVADLAIAAGRAMGVVQGVVKGDMVYTSDGPRVIEIATRLSGGWSSSHQIPLSTGVNFIGAAIRLALGDKVSPDDLVPTRSDAAVIRFLFLPNGRVKSVPDISRWPLPDSVRLLKLFVRPGDLIDGIRNHTQRGGCVVVCHRHKPTAIAEAESWIGRLAAGVEVG
ncbi:MAG: ATP-grasp domain-containing protein [Negativicutes bacterium]|nr:ATP-grasp domain-containing protein [Negativicutes bacterium]